MIYCYNTDINFEVYHQLLGNTEYSISWKGKDISAWSMTQENQVRKQLLIVTVHKSHMEKSGESRTNESQAKILTEGLWGIVVWINEL